MNSIFEIKPNEIELLDSDRLVDLMNHLLSAEADKIGISPDNVKTSLKKYIPDGGVDARIVISKEVESRWIPLGLSIWQFKSGNIFPREIEKEFNNKPGVQEVVTQGGSYCLVIGKDYTDKERQSREKRIEQCFLDISLTPRYRLYTASDISRWASEHPTIALLPDFSRPIGELMRFEKWEKQEAHQIPFQYDEQRTKIINEIREVIQKGSRLNNVRIEGLAGVGKTRLVMESLKVSNLGERVLYATSVRDIHKGFFTWVEHNTRIELIIVVDECDENDSQILNQHAERCNGRLKLITIGQSMRSVFPSPYPRNVFVLGQLSNEVIEKIIKNRFPNIPQIAVNFIANVSSGYVKIATTLADDYMMNPRPVSATEMAKKYNFPYILRAIITDGNKLKGMKAIALLSRVGWEGELVSEGKVLANFINLEWGELQDVIEGMRKSELVAKQGRYRYVTPHLLGVWLASEVWDARGDSIVELIINLPNTSSRRALLERIADLGDHERVQQAVDKILSEEGLFPDMKSLDSKERSEMFSFLAEAYPRAGLRALERILKNLPREKLLSFKEGRREVVWTLEKLAWLPETFLGAAQILLALAEAENEPYGNNATNIWCGLFKTYLGGTAVPAIERHKLIKEALDSESVDCRILAVKAIESAFITHYHRFVSGELQRGRLVPPEWRPRTFEEDINVRRSALIHLDLALQDQHEKVSNEARKVLLDHAGALVYFAMADEMLDRLEKLDMTTDEQRFAIRATLEEILENQKSKLTQEQKDRINNFILNLIGDTFHDRLIRWVGRWTHIDWIKGDGENATNQIIGLAKEAYNNFNLLFREIDWFASDEAVNVWFFARTLGQLDESKKLLEEFVRLARRGKGYILLSAYLVGRADDGEQKWREDLLDKWAEEEPNMAEAILDATWRGYPSSRGAKRLISLVDNKKLNASSLRLLMIGTWTSTLPSNLIVDLINHLMQTSDSQDTEAALSMMHYWIETHPDKLSEISYAAWKLIECPIAITGSTILSYHWEKITEYFIDDNPSRIVKSILRAYAKSELIRDLSDRGIKMLEKATFKNREAIWKEVSKYLLKEGERRGYHFLLALEGWYGDLFKAEYLIEWAKRHPDKGPIILAYIAQVGGAKLSELARLVLINFADQKGVKSELMNNFLGEMFSGSMSLWLKGKLEDVKSWMNDPNLIIQSWAKDLAEIIEEEIKRAKLEEEEGW